MRIKLYQCLCENNRMYKESFMINEIILDGNARLPINKSNPTFYIEDVNFEKYLNDDNNIDVVFDIESEEKDIAYSLNGQTYNYLFVEDWERYYFIEPITFTNNKMYIINGTLDTLMSFKNKEWKNHPLYITRRTNGSSFISDNLIQFKYNKTIKNNNGETISDIESRTKGYQSFGIPYSDYGTYRNTYCIVVAVSNPVLIDTLEYADYSYIPTARDNGTDRMKKATSNMSFSQRNTIYYCITPRMLLALCNHVLTNSSIMGNILSITILPYLIDTENTHDGHIMNFFPSTSLDYSELDGQFNDYCVKQAKYGNNDRFIYRTIEIPEAQSYRDYEPYCEAHMYIPYADTIKLNLQSVRGCTLRLYYYVDFDTSNSTYILYNVTRDKIENTGTCQLGYKFTLTTSNAEEIKKTQENNLTKFLFGTMASGISLMSGNPQAIIGSTRGIINNMSQFIQRENSVISRGQANATSSNVGSMLPLEPYIEWYIDDMTFTEQGYENYKNNIGLPFNDNEYIYNITDGEHVIVGDTSDITMSSDVTSEELDTFKNALASGFYK